MSKYLKALLLSIAGVFLCTGLYAQVAENEERELSLEEAMKGVDQVAPLPEFDPEINEPISLILSEGEEPDYNYLRFLQIEEQKALKKEVNLANKNRLNDNFLSQQFSHTVLHDPLKIFNQNEFHLYNDLLNRYSKKSTPPLIVNILTSNEITPLKRMRRAGFHELLSQAPNGILIYYFLDKPEETKIIFGKNTYKTISLLQQRDFLLNALKAQQTQKDPFYANYRHLQSLIDDLLDHHSKSSEGTLNLGHSPETSPSIEEKRENLSNRRSEILIPTSIALLFIAIIVGFIYTLYSQVKSKTIKIKVNKKPSVLKFKVAKDTTQAISFKK